MATISTGTLVWVVTDPTPTSEIFDVCTRMSLESFVRSCRGGLTEAHRPALHTDESEALQDARNRAEKHAADYYQLSETIKRQMDQLATRGGDRG